LKTDELILPIMIIIGLFGGVLTLLALESYYGETWGTVASSVTAVLAAIGIFAIVVVAIVRYAK